MTASSWSPVAVPEATSTCLMVITKRLKKTSPTLPPQDANFSSIFARSTSAMTSGEKFS